MKPSGETGRSGPVVAVNIGVGEDGGKDDTPEEELSERINGVGPTGLTHHGTAFSPDMPAVGGFGAPASSFTGSSSRSMSDILRPNGEPVGYVYPGSGSRTRTVAPEQFEPLRSELMDGAVPKEAPKGYQGTWYQRSDGAVFGIRTSKKNGTTIDVIKSNDPALESGFKVHKK
jgi:filamentous hemagglutinin